MSMQIPMRLTAAELALIEQLQAAGATTEAERLAIVGLPTRRIEAYHYTDLKTLLRTVPPASEPATEAGKPAFDIPGAAHFRILNGEVAPAPAAAGIHAHVVDASPLTLRDDALVHLNVGLVRQALALELSGNPPVVVIDRSLSGEPGHAASGAHIFVADGTTATIVDVGRSGSGKHLSNHGGYIAVGKGAKVTHIAFDLSGGEATSFATYEYHLGEQSQLRTLSLNAGSVLSRTQVFVRFGGPGAHADLTGLNLVGAGQHHDITLEAVHAVPHTSCKPLYKQVGRGRSTAAFQGKLVVARDAQKTDSKLMMQGLMLSEEVDILSKPELEIYADDVVCGHGSTCGALDQNSLFYLMSRGIPRAEAEAILTRAFIEEVIDPIADEGVRAALTGVVDKWLAGP